MDAVKTFNHELSSIYDGKPPVSKAKMTAVTKAALKALKFYKHVVQSVEKFIQKCRPEYKVPGLYVVDSIVRQSRHQFGQEKDVFGPRFIKNIGVTFTHIFKCVEADRARVIKVLNLWQKNSIFPANIISCLVDMANPDGFAKKKALAACQVASAAFLESRATAGKGASQDKKPSIKKEKEEKAKARKEKSAKENVASADNAVLTGIDPALLNQVQALTSQLLGNKGAERTKGAANQPPASSPSVGPALGSVHVPPPPGAASKSTAMAAPTPQQPPVALQPQPPPARSSPHKKASAVAKETKPLFNKKLLDFDYGDDDEEEEPSMEVEMGEVSEDDPGSYGGLWRDRNE